MKESLVEKLKKDTVKPLETTDYLSILIEIKKFIEASNIDNIALGQGLLSLEQVSKEAKNNNEAIIKGKDILELLAQNLPVTKSDPLKAEIFHVILNDCSDYYRNNEDVNNTYQWLKEVGVRFSVVRTASLNEETLTSENFNFNKKSAELEPVVIELEQILETLGITKDNFDANDL